MKRGFLDLLDPSNDPEFFWQVISGPPCIFKFCNVNNFFNVHYIRIIVVEMEKYLHFLFLEMIQIPS
jgi:hypothetical protein